jgi:hypothetical protein
MRYYDIVFLHENMGVALIRGEFLGKIAVVGKIEKRR